MGNIIIPGQEIVLSEEEFVTQAADSAPIRSLSKLRNAGDRSVDFMSINVRGLTGRNLVAELQKRFDIDIVEHVRFAVAELRISGLPENQKARMLAVVERVAKVGGPVSVAVKAIYDDPSFNPRDAGGVS